MVGLPELCDVCGGNIVALHFFGVRRDCWWATDRIDYLATDRLGLITVMFWLESHRLQPLINCHWVLGRPVAIFILIEVALLAYNDLFELIFISCGVFALIALAVWLYRKLNGIDILAEEMAIFKAMF